jgi:hypothetical protein
LQEIKGQSVGGHFITAGMGCPDEGTEILSVAESLADNGPVEGHTLLVDAGVQRGFLVTTGVGAGQFRGPWTDVVLHLGYGTFPKMASHMEGIFKGNVSAVSHYSLLGDQPISMLASNFFADRNSLQPVSQQNVIWHDQLGIAAICGPPPVGAPTPSGLHDLLKIDGRHTLNFHRMLEIFTKLQHFGIFIKSFNIRFHRSLGTQGFLDYTDPQGRNNDELARLVGLS